VVPGGNILVARTRDALGNESFARADGQFGVDLVAPVFNFVDAAGTGSPANQSVYRTAPPAFQFSFPFVEGNVSGTIFNPEVRIIRYTSTPAATRCVNPNDHTDIAVPTGGCEFVVAAGTTVSLPAVAGYYEVTFRFRDNAGNLSDTQTRTVLIDAVAPTVTTGAFERDGNMVGLAGSMTDNVDLRGWDMRMRFTGAAAPAGATSADLPFTTVNMVGSFGVANRVGSFTIPSQTATVWRSLRVTDEATGAIGAQANADGVGFGAWDMARNFNSAFLTIGGQAGGAAPTGLANLTISMPGTTFCNTLTPRPSGDQGFANCTTTAPATPTSRIVTVRASAPEGVAFPVPFTMVHFYRVDPQGNVWFLGTSTNFVSGSIGVTNQIVHDWTFNVDATGWQGSFAANDQRIFAVGVTSARDAVRTPSSAITVQGAANQP
jgi:hypothetical protein